MSATAKFCIDCRWCKRELKSLYLASGAKCLSPKTSVTYCENALAFGDECGPKARYFEPKP